MSYVTASIHNGPVAAKGSFPYPHRTQAEIMAEESARWAKRHPETAKWMRG